MRIRLALTLNIDRAREVDGGRETSADALVERAERVPIGFAIPAPWTEET